MARWGLFICYASVALAALPTELLQRYRIRLEKEGQVTTCNRNRQTTARSSRISVVRKGTETFPLGFVLEARSLQNGTRRAGLFLSSRARHQPDFLKRHAQSSQKPSHPHPSAQPTHPHTPLSIRPLTSLVLVPAYLCISQTITHTAPRCPPPPEGCGCRTTTE